MLRRIVLFFAAGCSSHHVSPSSATRLPLVPVADVALPGGATRFDYQAIDENKGQLVIAHMKDNSVLVVALADGSVRKELPNINTPRGVAIGDGTIFVTALPNQLVLIDSATLAEVARVTTGTSPDGDAWDPVDQVVGVSDQGDGALSLIEQAGRGTRTQVPLGEETGNVVFDATRGQFWITVVAKEPPNQLVAVDPKAKSVTERIPLPGCDGAHGLRLHPDGQSALIACEGNDTLMRIALTSDHAIATAATGEGPDVLSIDPKLGWLYVAAESGDLTVFDLGKPGLALLGHEDAGAHAHTIAADPATHRVFLPLPQGANGKPVLRIMKPTGT